MRKLAGYAIFVVLATAFCVVMFIEHGALGLLVLPAGIVLAGLLILAINLID